MLSSGGAASTDAIASLLLGASASNEARFDRMKLLERRMTAPIGELSNQNAVAPQNLASGFDAVAAAVAALPTRAKEPSAPHVGGERRPATGGTAQFSERSAAPAATTAQQQAGASGSKLARASSEGPHPAAAGTEAAAAGGNKRRKFAGGGRSPAGDDSSRGEAAAATTSPGEQCMKMLSAHALCRDLPVQICIARFINCLRHACHTEQHLGAYKCHA